MIELMQTMEYIQKDVSYDHLILGIGYISRMGYLVGLTPPETHYLTGGWGCAFSVGIGMTTGLSDKQIIVIDGDGSFLHSTSFLITLKTLQVSNIHFIIIENQCYDSTGGQPIEAFGNGLSIKNIIYGYGFKDIAYIRNSQQLDLLNRKGVNTPRFSIVKTNRVSEKLARIPKKLIVNSLSKNSIKRMKTDRLNIDKTQALPSHEYFIDKLRVIDCTLRDGGNLNNWDFDLSLINRLLKTLFYCNVDYVEVGYYGGSSSKKPEHPGLTANCNQKFFEQLEDVKELKERLAVMVSPNQVPIKGLEIITDLPVGLVRVAGYVWDYEKSLTFVSYLAERGLKVSLNLMGISYVDPSTVEKISHSAKGRGAQVLYMADSFGHLTPDRVSQFVNAALVSNIDVGFHCHNNLGFALENALTAFDTGASFIDASVMGMGRGAGNTPIEMLLNYFRNIRKSQKYKFWEIAEFADEVILPIIKNYWPESVKRRIGSGANNLHFYYTALIESLCVPNNIPQQEIYRIIGNSRPHSVSLENVKDALTKYTETFHRRNE